MKKHCFIYLFILLSCNFQTFGQSVNIYKNFLEYSLAEDLINDARLHHYDVGFYFLDLEMTNDSIYVKGNTRIDLNLNESYNNELVFDLKSGMTVDSVKINGETMPFTHNDDLIIIDYIHRNNYSEVYHVSAKIFYEGRPERGIRHDRATFGGEWFTFVYSLSEPCFAKYWFPCKQVLEDKADSSYFYVTIPENLKAGSNGLLINEYSVGNGNKRMEWQSSYPIAYYLISFALGKYREYSFYVDIPETDISVFVQNYIPDNNLYFESTKQKIDNIKDMIIFFSNLLGPYPFHLEKYGHCITPISGGMEHQTMTTIGLFDKMMLSHELVHSWFGNSVTCATWQDVWINEGFATYGECLVSELLMENGMSRISGMQNNAKRATTESVYVSFELFTTGPFGLLAYTKGACVIHMIRYLINNDELFFSSLRKFLDTYKNKTATGEDIKRVFEEETNIDFEVFFNEWYYGEGYPTYSIVWQQTENNLRIRCEQTTSSDNTPLFTTPLEFKIIYDDNSEVSFRENIGSNLTFIDFPVDRTVTDVIPNPNNWILADVSSLNSVKDHETLNCFSVSPNPSDGKINIYTNINYEFDLELINLTGNLIWSGSFSGNSFELDFSYLSKGVYFLKFSATGNVYTEKLVIY